jgi:hypothetical protein
LVGKANTIAKPKSQTVLFLLALFGGLWGEDFANCQVICKGEMLHIPRDLKLFL